MMTTAAAPGPARAAGSAEPFLNHERSRIRAAARHARRVYPGEIGELIFRELTAYAEFGIRFSVDALVPRLATRILAMRAEDGDPPEVSSIVDRRPTRAAVPAGCAEAS